jgi:MFS transporter, DHA1 family, tetracycline resistance protein
MEGEPSKEPQTAAVRASGRALPTLLLVIFMNLLGFGIVIPLLPFYASSFQAPAWQIALIFSAYSIGAFFGEPFWGRLSDRVGRKPILLSTVFGNCLCYGLLAFAPNVYVAFVIRLIGGAMSGNGSVIQGYIADVTPPDRRSGRMALLGVAFNIGFIVGPFVGGKLAHPDWGPLGFQIPLLVASGLSALSALGILLFVRESRPERPVGEDHESRWKMLGYAVTEPVISRLMLVTFLSGCAFFGIESVFGLWGERRFDWGPQEIGTMFGFVGVTAALCQLFLTGWASRRFGEANVLAFGMAIALVGTFLQVFSTGMLMSTLLLCLGALGTSVAFPNVSALISRTADPDSQGQLLGLNNATGALARVVGPLAAGLTFADIHRDGQYVLGAALLVPAIWLALRVARRLRRIRERT